MIESWGAWYRMHSKSLRWKIQVWHALILAILITGFAGVLYGTQRWTRLRQIDQELAAAAEIVMGQWSRTEVRNSQPAPKIELPSTFAPRRFRRAHEAPYYVIWDQAGKVWNRDGAVADRAGVVASAVNPNAMTAPRPDRFSSQASPSQETQRRVRFRNRGELREAFLGGPGNSWVLVGRFIGPDRRDLQSLLAWLAGVGAAVFVIGLAGGWILSARSVSPIEDISRVASDISERSLSERIDSGQMNTELAELSHTLNEMFARLESAFDRQKQFTGDASHELRTPLSVLQVHQQLALSRERTPAEYRETLRVCQRATRQMSELIESLLTLARVDSAGSVSHEADETVTVDLADLVAAAAEPLQTLADAKSIAIELSQTPAKIDGDPSQLNQLINNLLSNAISHCPAESRVQVGVTADDQEATLVVTDNGPGIADEHVPHLFDRFYRVDAGRSRDLGGTGLGLSICKTIAEAHRGAISVQSTVGQGSTFRVTFPLAAPPDSSN